MHSELAVEGDALPTEFRIFKAGANGATHDPFIFDAKAAADVMSEYERHGVELMIDLEHESYADEAPRADSRDARGWFRLEMRGGELWAVNVRWTEDGARRLREKTQRYISPTFTRHKKTGRVGRLMNVALTAMPAMYAAPALVAASDRTREALLMLVAACARNTLR